MRQTHKTVHFKRWVEIGSPQMHLRISRVLAYYAFRACWERPYPRELCDVSEPGRKMPVRRLWLFLSFFLSFFHSFTDCFCPLRSWLNFPPFNFPGTEIMNFRRILCEFLATVINFFSQPNGKKEWIVWIILAIKVLSLNSEHNCETCVTIFYFANR